MQFFTSLFSIGALAGVTFAQVQYSDFGPKSGSGGDIGGGPEGGSYTYSEKGQVGVLYDASEFSGGSSYSGSNVGDYSIGGETTYSTGGGSSDSLPYDDPYKDTPVYGKYG